jgi:hypothetical protein
VTVLVRNFEETKLTLEAIGQVGIGVSLPVPAIYYSAIVHTQKI